MPVLYGVPDDEDAILDKLLTLDFDVNCAQCVHYKGGSKCDAFKQIPADILSGRKKHQKPVEGDNGIQFEPKKKGKKALDGLSNGELADLIQQTLQTVEEAGQALVQRQEGQDGES